MAKKSKKSPKKEARKPMRSSMEQISVKDFEALVRRCKDYQTKARGLSGKAGSEIKDAVEFKNLDRVAFAIFRKLDAMQPAKLATSLACFDYYRDIGKLDEKSTEQAELDIDRPEAGKKTKRAVVSDPADGGAKEESSNVVSLQQAAAE